MLIWIFTRDDETGLLDGEFRNGDISQTKPDSFEPSIGNIEKRTNLIIKVPDPPNYPAFEQELVEPEYAAGPTTESANVVRRKRKFRIDWQVKFDAAEIALIESANDTLPDGVTSGGGTVTAGVVDGLFTISDIIRK